MGGVFTAFLEKLRFLSKSFLNHKKISFSAALTMGGGIYGVSKNIFQISLNHGGGIYDGGGIYSEYNGIQIIFN